MVRKLTVLNAVPPTTTPFVAIDEPCTESWEQMQGDRTIRYCTKCSTSVVALSELQEGEVQQLLTSEQPACVRIVHNALGQMITRRSQHESLMLLLTEHQRLLKLKPE